MYRIYNGMPEILPGTFLKYRGSIVQISVSQLGARGPPRGATSRGLHLGLCLSIDSNILILRPSKQNPEIVSMFAVTFACCVQDGTEYKRPTQTSPRASFALIVLVSNSLTLILFGFEFFAYSSSVANKIIELK